MEKLGKLRKNSEFKHVYNKGKVYSNHLLVLYIVKNGTDYNRAGFSVSKKVGKSVVRNKVRRRIKESYRLNSAGLKKGYNFVFISRVKAKDATYKEIEKAMLSLFKKSELFIE
ncbi:ribonuclease P protein component [Oxobacter pfennigii]|uniref:Ribonuclease P protein component n=1 Tax=Oxobacter pfennigii TaxID=36849 RepID=A0A0P8YTD1_9CLOT|nr:ribonuclease P protein component [Oxobacter pfennigii]KPU42954.1 ribonuclease P protein component [Oxobacter pfennigii]